MTQHEESMLVFAARYAHSRNTCAAHMVVNEIISKWPDISESTRRQLARETQEAAYNHDDWQKLVDLIGD